MHIVKIGNSLIGKFMIGIYFNIYITLQIIITNCFNLFQCSIRNRKFFLGDCVYHSPAAFAVAGFKAILLHLYGIGRGLR